MPRGSVVGIDASTVIQARRRVARAAQGLRNGSTCGRLRLPLADGSFERACSINSLPFWPSAERGLAEIRRVLRPGGRFVLALRRRCAGASRFDRSSRAFTDERLDDVAALLVRTGFRDASRTTREISGESIAIFDALR